MQISVSRQHPVAYPLQLSQTLLTYYPILTVSVIGAFIPPSYENVTDDRLYVYLEKRNQEGQEVPTFENNYRWEIPIYSEGSIGGRVPETKVTHEFNLKELTWK